MKLEIVGVQLRALEDKDEESSLIIDGLQRQCKKKDQEIERLNDEYTNIYEKVIRVTKMQKVDPGSQLQEVTAKIAHLEAKHAKQAQLIKMMQEELALTRSEAQKWWEVAQQRTTSLSEFREKEKKGLAHIGRICEEMNRAIDKVNELQALISFYKQKAKEVQANCNNMSHVVHQQWPNILGKPKMSGIGTLTHLWVSLGFSVFVRICFEALYERIMDRTPFIIKCTPTASQKNDQSIQSLVIKVSREEGSNVKPLRIVFPSSFPYESNKVVPWVYDIQTSVNENISNISGIGGMTRSVGDKLVIVQAEDDMLISKPSALPYMDAAKEAIETSFQALEIANMEKFPRNMKMVAQMLVKTGYQLGQGLGKDSQGTIELPIIKDNPRKQGLGYDPAKDNNSTRNENSPRPPLGQIFRKAGIQISRPTVVIKCPSPSQET
ncbi:hypothetical protein Fmac_008284 [Flemingia macrophylla]|uniref:G-patch domain-containing protein n=1 Tax=Flemingia macrophylla TaxID=520843 RepID=A0ABD1MX18_9FABA